MIQMKKDVVVLSLFLNGLKNMLNICLEMKILRLGFFGCWAWVIIVASSQKIKLQILRRK